MDRAFRRLERGSYVTTDFLDALRDVRSDLVILLLYARAIASKPRYLPSPRRLARIMGRPEGEVNELYKAAGREGLWTSQWLGSANILRSGRGAYITIRMLNELGSLGVPPDKILILIRNLPYVDVDGKLVACADYVARRSGIPVSRIKAAFKLFRELQIMDEDRRLASYLVS